MGFFDFLRAPDINAGAAQFTSTPGSVLLDVRTPEEYRGGHIPGSKNLPLQAMDAAPEKIKQKETPVFVYCLSGGRSRQAVAFLNRMGYTKVTNIGGISGYRGELEVTA